MKKLLLALLIIPFVGVNAQIFINTNPNAKGTESTIIKENQTIDKTKKELQTTRTNVEEVKTNLTSPNYNGNNTVKSNVTGSSVSGTSVSGSSNGYSNTNSYTNTTSGSNVTGSSVSGSSNSYNSGSSSSYGSGSARVASSSFSGSGDVPPNAVPGKCYARCQTEDQYRFNTKQVVNTPKMVKRIQLPALYTTVYDTVIVRPRSVRYENVPAVYENVREQKMSAPSTTKWVKGQANAGCLSADPNDCQVMCLVEVPAQYITVTKRVLKQESYKREISVPMEYKIVAKQVRTQNERYAEQVIPATYKTLQERVLVSKGGYQGWREVVCGSDITSAKISQIQNALRAAGYNPGPSDNVFGSQTKEALKAYQRAKGLPVGNLNMETMRSLGL